MNKLITLFIVVIIFAGNSFASKIDLSFKDNLTKIGYCKTIEQTWDSDFFFEKRIYGHITSCSREEKSDKLKELIKNLGFKTKESNNDFFGVKTTQYGNLYVRLSDDKLIFLKQFILKSGSKAQFKAENDNNIFFYLDMPPDKYTSLTVNMDNKSTLYLKMEGENKYNKLKESVDYNIKLFGEYSTKYILYGLPQIAGRFLVKAELDKSEYPAVFSVSMMNEYGLEKIEKSSKIGGLILRNVPYGSAKAEPQNGVDIIHPEANLSGDATPNSETVFWLPAGRWGITVYPFNSKDSFMGELKSHLIPVSGGYITVVNWPASLKNLFENEDNVKIKILKAQLKDKNTAQINISLLNFKEKEEPSVKEFEITESNKNATVIKVERLKTPPQIAILLDSSGSMRKSMKKAKIITAEFIKKLPNNSLIYLIDFDTKPKLVSKGSKKDALRALRKVRANGATALYDAIDMGINLLQDKNRPELIVFTDGRDANYNDTKRQSKINKSKMLNIIKTSHIPTFTIGFGKNPDKETLSRIATLGKGKYYYAKNATVLKGVFESIKNNLGHQWKITIKRPKDALDSDVPV